MKSPIDLWANFLFNEKIVAGPKVGEQWTFKIIKLCEELAKTGSPKIRPYKAKIETRKIVVEKAMDLGIDLPSIKNQNGRAIIGRGLLDVWNQCYNKRHGSIIGTQGQLVATHRDIVTKLSKEEQ